jgi:hypothetical protein
MNGHDNFVSHLLKKGAQVDARDKVRIDMYVGPMYRLAVLSCHATEFHPP